MRTSTDTLTIAADVVGVVSAALGGVLALAPHAGGRWLGLGGTSVRRRRMLGAVDLGLGLAIVAGRASDWRWRAVAARSLLHLAFAREYVRGDRRGSAAAMCALFAVDAGVAAGLRRDVRSHHA